MNPGEPHINNLNSGLIFSSLIFYVYCISYIVYLHTEIAYDDMYDYPPTVIIWILYLRKLKNWISYVKLDLMLHKNHNT